VVPSPGGRDLGSRSPLLRAAERPRLHAIVEPVFSARRRGIHNTPAGKALRVGGSSVSCALHRSARVHYLLRVLRFGAVHDGARCAQSFCDKPYYVDVPGPRRIFEGLCMDGYHPVVQRCSRIGRLGAIAQQNRRPSCFSLSRRWALAPRRRRRRVRCFLRVLLVLVEPFVLVNDTRIHGRSPRDRSLTDGRCARSIVAILSARQSSLLDEVLDAFCGIRRRRAGAALSREPPREAFGSNAALYRRRRLVALCDRQWRARSLWIIRMQRRGGRGPHLELAIEGRRLEGLLALT
jgi:hypothetical protein